MRTLPANPRCGRLAILVMAVWGGAMLGLVGWLGAQCPMPVEQPGPERPQAWQLTYVIEAQDRPWFEAVLRASGEPAGWGRAVRWIPAGSGPSSLTVIHAEKGEQWRGQFDRGEVQVEGAAILEGALLAAVSAGQRAGGLVPVGCVTR